MFTNANFHNFQCLKTLHFNFVKKVNWKLKNSLNIIISDVNKTCPKIADVTEKCGRGLLICKYLQFRTRPLWKNWNLKLDGSSTKCVIHPILICPVGYRMIKDEQSRNTKRCDANIIIGHASGKLQKFLKYPNWIGQLLFMEIILVPRNFLRFRFNGRCL